MTPSKYTAPPPRRRSADAFWNVLTALVLVGIFLTAGLFAFLFYNPNVPFNPYPPPTLPATLALPPPVATFTLAPAVVPDTAVPSLPPSATHTETSSPVPPTNTPRPTHTEQPTATITLTPSKTPTITRTPLQPATRKTSRFFSFVLQSDPRAIDATIFNPEHGCEWVGVAGQAVDIQGRPINGIPVQVGGSINGVEMQVLYGLTGTVPEYGQAGYEITLPTKPINSKGKIWVRLLDQSAMIQISEQVYFDTFSDCQKNLILINFKQVR